jgi:hypothetical protein
VRVRPSCFRVAHINFKVFFQYNTLLEDDFRSQKHVAILKILNLCKKLYQISLNGGLHFVLTVLYFVPPSPTAFVWLRITVTRCTLVYKIPRQAEANLASLVAVLIN